MIKKIRKIQVNSSERKSELIKESFNSLRAKLLRDTDWTQLPDYPGGESLKDKWRIWRSNVRDLIPVSDDYETALFELQRLRDKTPETTEHAPVIIQDKALETPPLSFEEKITQLYLILGEFHEGVISRLKREMSVIDLEKYHEAERYIADGYPRAVKPYPMLAMAIKYIDGATKKSVADEWASIKESWYEKVVEEEERYLSLRREVYTINDPLEIDRVRELINTSYGC